MIINNKFVIILKYGIYKYKKGKIIFIGSSFEVDGDSEEEDESKSETSY